MSEPACKPYEGYKVYKVFHKQMGRWMACLVSPTHRTTISYARYVMATKLGRPLEKWEQVDHINNDRSDDSVGNLQILTQADNLSKSRRHKSYVKRTCPVCLVEFYSRSARLGALPPAAQDAVAVSGATERSQVC